MSLLQNPPLKGPWPPLIYAGGILLAIALSWLLPLPWLPRPLSDFAFAAGIVIILCAFWIGYAALQAMNKAGTPVRPTERAEHLVTKGPFGFTRNPLYLGMTMVLLGIGLALGLLWFLGLAILAAFLTQKIAIEPEEKHLEQRFGKAYRDYRKRVRRWV